MSMTIELPQVGESVMEGTIQNRLKQVGDSVEKYEPLVEVVTDKVTMELPAPANGVLVKILAEEGTTIPMGAPICEMDSDDIAREDVHVPADQQIPAPQSLNTTGVLVEPVGEMGPTGVREIPTQASGTTALQSNQRPRISPVVQKLASEHSISLEEIAKLVGSGMDGRVTKQDFLNFINTRETQNSLDTTDKIVGQDEILRLTPVRKRISEHMMQSASEIPTAWSMVECDVTGMVNLRESLKEQFRIKEGISLTYLPFMVKLVAESLKDHALLNSQWSSEGIILKTDLNVGIAVAAPQGLVVPVIHNADRIDITQLARILADLIMKARENKLRLEDIQGGTFTINNTGALGSIISKPIVNYPQAAIITNEAIVKRPVVIGDAIGIRSIMNVCLSFDHRILDGLEAGTYLQDIKKSLESINETTPVG